MVEFKIGYKIKIYFYKGNRYNGIFTIVHIADEVCAVLKDEQGKYKLEDIYYLVGLYKDGYLKIL